MSHVWDKKNNIVFVILIVIGAGLCIGGLFVPGLLVPGGVLLSGAFGMWASAYVRMYPWMQAEEAPVVETPIEHPNVYNVNIDDHHIEFHPHYDVITRPSHPTPEQQELHHAKSAPQLTYI